MQYPRQFRISKNDNRMKRIVLTAALLIAALMTVAAYMNPQNRSARSRDSRGHVLVKEWERYAQAQAKDRPQLQEEIAGEIIEKAKAAHLAWDFYDAWDQYRQVRVRRNWKESELVSIEFGEDVSAFGDPLVTFLYNERFRGWDNADALAFAMVNSSALMAQRSDAFYGQGSISHEMGGQLPSYVADDYEFALWECGAYSSLGEYLGAKYPNAAYAEYLAASRSWPVSEARLKLLAEEYDGKAVGMFPRADLLEMRRSELMRDGKGTSVQYRELYEDCLAFEKDRKAFSGREAAIVRNLDRVRLMADDLSSKSIMLHTEKDTVIVMVRNMRSLKLSVAEKDNPKKVVHKASLANGKGSFHVYDTLRTVLPRIDDGTYVVEAVGEGEREVMEITRHTVSLASRSDSEGLKVYAADYLSGKPLEMADLVLSKNGFQVCRKDGFRFDGGFTALPREMESEIGGNGRYVISCEYRDGDGFLRKSPGLSLYAASGSGTDRSVRQYCNVYLNMGAYHPGDTVKFKGLLYEGNLIDDVRVAPEGMEVKASVLDSEGNEVDDIDLVTNGFGSVAGEFAIPEGLRNGMFTVRLRSGRYHGTASFRVDEFVLPTYEIRFDELDRLVLPGDVITFTGKVVSYSGHSISDAVVTYELAGTGAGQTGSLDLAADGSFSLDVKTSAQLERDYGWQVYNLSVKVTDATGETQEAGYGVAVQKIIYMNLDFLDAVQANYEIKDGRLYHHSISMVDSDTVRVRMEVTSSQGAHVRTDVRYVLKNEQEEELARGVAQSGDVVQLDLSGHGSGMYSIHAEAGVVDSRGEAVKAESVTRFLRVAGDDKVLDAPLKNFYRAFDEELESGEMIRAQLGSADGPMWAVVELFGDGRKLLERRMVALEGERGKTGSLENIGFEYRESYPDAVLLQVFYFKDGRGRSFSTQFRRRKHTLDLPLSWERFEDRTVPGSPYRFVLKTAPDTEILAAIYDVSVDRINQLHWNTVSLREFSVPSVPVSSVCGSTGWDNQLRMSSARVMKSAGPMVMMNSVAMDAMPMDAGMVFREDRVMTEPVEESAEVSDNGAGVRVREDFSAALAFEPFLHGGKDGRAELDFVTSDKLSTFNVMLFAHDRNLRNNLLCREMTVSIPVKVSVLEPQYLYVGDKYRMSVSVSSIADRPISGTLWLYQYDGPVGAEGSAAPAAGKPVKVSSARIMVPAGGSKSHGFDVLVPNEPGERVLKAVFVSDGGASGAGRDDGFSDAVLVSIPVYACAQTLTEAHSAVLLPGMDRAAEMERIRKAFVNVSPYGAESREISIIDMVKDALPSSAEPGNDDVLTLTESYYVRKVASSLGVRLKVDLSDERLVGKILACRNADGGFGWYEGMDSSPVITAVILERLAKLERLGSGTMDLDPSLRNCKASAVRYLDSSYFHVDRPYWCGGISAAQYLYVRSLHAEVPFDVKPSGREQEKRMADFSKYVRECLVPKGDRGLTGQILDKARRLRTLSGLVSSDEGLALASAWGVNLGARRKMLSSLEDDVISLLEYAVDHKDGGIYYPNAVMPYRGLLESEAYAHSMLCDLFADYASGFALSSGASGRGASAPVDSDSDVAVPVARSSEAARVADGIRIWLMLQKETQKWGEEPAYVDALASVLAGSDEVKATKVILLTKTYRKPFREVMAAGNGFRVDRKFFLDGKEIEPGTVLKVGDRIHVEYRIWNGENRSFVVLRAAREAGLRPVQQLSGMYGWGISPLRVNGWFSFQPHGYRNVKASVTEYYFDSYPEENTVVTEEFYVTQAGSFSAPVVEIESLYAPHYRANAGYSKPLEIVPAQ